MVASKAVVEVELESSCGSSASFSPSLCVASVRYAFPHTIYIGFYCGRLCLAAGITTFRSRIRIFSFYPVYQS